MIEHRYNRIPHPSQGTQTRRHRVTPSQAESQEVSSPFPCRCPPDYPKQNQQIVKD